MKSLHYWHQFIIFFTITCRLAEFSWGIPTHYSIDNLHVLPVFGDGHCIVNSVLACMKIAQQEFPVPEKDVLLCEIRKGVLLNLDYCGQFLNSEEIDPIHEIDAFINMGKYNTPTNDLMLNIISNLLECQIIILQHNPVSNNWVVL